jgi:hypothetical protein
MRQLVNRSLQRWAYISRTDKPSSQIAFFLHGFVGNYLTTWGSIPQLLQTSADQHPPCDQWDYVFVGFDTKNVLSFLDVAAFVWSEWARASEGKNPLSHRYERFAIFAHSLGTLGVRQALYAWSRQPAGMLDSLHSITFLAPPLNGSPLAKYAFVFPIAEALKPNNPQLRMLRTWCQSAWGKHPWPKIRVILGQDDKVVGFSNAELVGWDGDGLVEETTLDHSSLSKSDIWDSHVMDFIKDGLR